MNPVIAIQDITKIYGSSGTLGLDNVSLSVYPGEKFGIFGPNGAGKTTLISILCNILKATAGTVTYSIDGKEMNLKEILPYVGFVPQDFAFYPELTAKQNLEYFGGALGMDPNRVKSRTDELLQILGLDTVAKKKVSSFSGGMKRRINLAIGLIHEPRIVFLDEPTVGVDVQSKLAIIQLLEELNKKGITLIYTSHHLLEAEDFCSRIALMDNGKIIAVNTLEALLEENNVDSLEDLLINLTGKQLRD